MTTTDQLHRQRKERWENRLSRGIDKIIDQLTTPVFVICLVYLAWQLGRANGAGRLIL